MSLLEILKDRPEDILLPNKSVETDALQNLKEALDAVAPGFSPLDSVYIDGLKVDQVWVQAQMILDGVSEKLSSQLEKYSASKDGDGDDDLQSGEELADSDASGYSSEDGQEPHNELSDSLEESDIDISNLKDDYEPSSEDEEEHFEDAKSTFANEEDQKHGSVSIEEEGDQEEEEEEEETEDSEDEKQTGGESHPQLIDGDFDLAEFQQHVLELEKNGDMEADDEHIDYFAELEDTSDDADMHYEDFFGPPPKRTKKTKRVKFTTEDDENNEEMGAENDEANLDTAMETTRKDLFDDDDDDDNDDYGNEGGEGGQKSQKTLSKFERQQQEIMRQIEQLEQENIGQKEWGMKGEAQAKDRPEDSLFNIDFERNAKPAPVITEETTLSIEEIIKERIRKQQFDDIPRRSEVVAPALKRDLPELSDSKSQKSLAEQYEEDHMRQANPEYFAKQDTAAMDAAHREIVEMFTSISRRLDALCSWQYTPKEAAPSLTVVSDTPSISMEEAQPGTMAMGSQLAPQEVYKSGAAVPMVNEEMSTSLKRKKRRDKAKAKAAKSGAAAPSSHGASSESKRGSKEQIYSTLKRGNVTVLDKRGQKRNMRGEEVTEKAPLSASRVKL